MSREITTIVDRDGARNVPSIHYAEETVLLPGVDEYGDRNEDHTGFGIEAESGKELEKACREAFGEGKLVLAGAENGPGASYSNAEDLEDEDEVAYFMYIYYTEENEI